MATNIGTSSLSTATAYVWQRHMFLTYDDVLIVLAQLGSVSPGGLCYKKSTDDGASWSSWTQIDSTIEAGFAACIDASGHLYIIYTDSGAKFRKLTYSGSGAWSIESQISLSSNLYAPRASINIRSTGQLFIATQYTSDATKYAYAYSNDGGSNWTSVVSSTLSVNVDAANVIPYGTKIRFILRLNTTTNAVRWWEWDTSITFIGNIAGANAGPAALSTTKISDSEIYVSFKKADGLWVYVWNGSTWDSGTNVSGNANDGGCNIGYIHGRVVFMWQDYYAVSQFDIYYKILVDGVWGSATALTSDHVARSEVQIIDNGKRYAHMMWTTGSSSPYTIEYDKVAISVRETILSDANIIIPSQTILSDALIVIPDLYDISNKVRVTHSILYHITNKVHASIRVLKDITNQARAVFRFLYDVENDVRAKKSMRENVLNDVRVLAQWQVPGVAGFQSLGKSYIKVYINSVEQPDVDVDSINISKDLSVSHTASFLLARQYDAAKPTMEAEVDIKYNNWLLYNGYITQIAPAEDPEHIRITCQNEYWKQNKENSYYQVGHKPTNNQELYYSTLQEALATKHSWSLSIGEFVPETLDNFAKGKSDAITALIQEAGNYEWFYDVDKSKKLWTAGEGNLVEIEKQTLGTNIGLYQIISHSFSENVENIINKYRVQMGNKIVRKFNSSGGNQVYAGYNYSNYQAFLIPAWNRNYEVLAKNSISGEGWDYHKPENAEVYRDVFKKYSLPYLDTDLSSWSDRYPPVVLVYGVIGSLFNAPREKITEGFTLDYENRLIVFNEPVYVYQENDYGEITAIRAPSLKVQLWKKNFYSFTANPSEDPETDVSNPLMFFTDKMGDYPDTILKDLSLSQFSVQEGGTTILPDGTSEIIPSWDDTEFARDYANWQLSKICDKRIRGTINITLDALVFYNIDLSKRIYIDGITDSPMNILSIDYNMSDFTASLTLENSRYFKRSVSLQSRGE